jgi:hypothetical protein
MKSAWGAGPPYGTPPTVGLHALFALRALGCGSPAKPGYAEDGS